MDFFRFIWYNNKDSKMWGKFIVTTERNFIDDKIQIHGTMPFWIGKNTLV